MTKVQESLGEIFVFWKMTTIKSSLMVFLFLLLTVKVNINLKGKHFFGIGNAEFAAKGTETGQLPLTA